ncbi:nucleotidyl transferase AbiEii/AbiGii toxin family protein [Candidatus Woesearchaeota archaeon]|nr:nucleotidyl transferase AbiEii/AbiGii toxin family protein [Candidatus Woesearchaeota archaeon]
MISISELKRIAAKNKVALTVVEKDYALTWILYGLSQITYNENFIFKGGTALRKMYFSEWRYSEDLDFTLTTPLAKEKIDEMINKVSLYLSEESGIIINIKSIYTNPEYAQIKIQFLGPLGNKNTIKLDLSFNELVVLKPNKKPIISEYSDQEKHPFLVYPLEEILAEKIRSILQRGKTRDFYDVWKILKKHLDRIDTKLLQDALIKKCKFKEIEFAEEKLFTNDITEPARAYWEKALAHQIGELPEFYTVLAESKELIHRLLKP